LIRLDALHRAAESGVNELFGELFHDNREAST
jgi:hypothetical protein